MTTKEAIDLFDKVRTWLHVTGVENPNWREVHNLYQYLRGFIEGRKKGEALYLMPEYKKMFDEVIHQEKVIYEERRNY